MGHPLAHDTPEIAQLIAAARAVIERWDTPSWKEAGPTAAVINQLRGAVSEATGDPHAWDPMDTPLPCAVSCDGATFGRGVPLRTFVEAATRWRREAFGPPPTKEEAEANLAVLQGRAPAMSAAGVGRAEALRGLRNLKVLLGTDALEVRGWAPAVQQAAQRSLNAAIRVLADGAGVRGPA